MADLFDDMEEEAEELAGVDDDTEDEEDVDEDDEPEERPSKVVLGSTIEPQSKQGVFADRDSVFDSGRKVDHRNPVVTRAEETANELMPLRRPVTTMAQLVAVFDAQGRPFVAYHQNGRALEKFRLPTPQEFEILRARGQIVKGGLGDAAPATVPPPPPPPPPPAANRTWLYVGAAAAAVGIGAWLYMKKQKGTSPKMPRANDDADADDEE
jgi:hypothetical protein